MPGQPVPVKHHYVPQGYLRAWSDAKGQIAVRRRNQPQTFPTNPVNVGMENRLHGRGIEAIWRENNFNALEDEWPRVRSALVARGDLARHDRDLVCLFMALQIARTREHIARQCFVSELAEYTEERPPSREVVRRFIQERHRHTPDDAEVEAARSFASYPIMNSAVPSFDEAFSTAMGIATKHLAPLLGRFEWRVEITESPILWTSDRPVMPWRPRSPSDECEGVGYENCDEIRMPLSPMAMLILRRRPSQSPVKVDAARFHDYNQDVALQCYEFVVCTPGRRGRLDHATMTPSRAALRFNTGPGFAPDGTPMGDVIHSWIPLRG